MQKLSQVGSLSRPPSFIKVLLTKYGLQDENLVGKVEEKGIDVFTFSYCGKIHKT